MTRRWLVLALLTLVLAAACSSGSDEAAPPTTKAGRSAGPVAWRRDDLTPIARPAVAGDTVIVYARKGRDLSILGLDAESGRTRWSHPATPSSVLQGVSIEVTVVGGDVVWFEPAAGKPLLGQVVAADPVTGKARWTSDALALHSLPAPCPDGRDVCISVSAAPDDPEKVVRFAAASGATRDEPGAPADARELTAGLFDLGTRDPEVLAGVDGGQVRWRTPVADAFGPGRSTDGGWYFVTDDDAGLYLGSIGDAVPEEATAFTYDLSKATMAALSVADGSVRWKDQGSSFACEGAVAVPRDPEQAAALDAPVWPVRCRATGTVTWRKDADEPEVSGVRVTVEGFDPATGRTTWTYDAGPAADGLVGLDDQDTQVVDDTVLILPADHNFNAVDVRTGKVVASASGSGRFWSQQRVQFDYREPFYYDGETPDYGRAGGTLSEPSSVPTTRSTLRVPALVGAKAGELRVVAQPGAVVAYRQPA